MRDETTEIDGALAAVPGENWSALDERERSYIREPATRLAHKVSAATDVRLYHAPEDLHLPHSGHHPILLSYLDVVVQGYLRLGDEGAVNDFFRTTDGWDAPILNDRAAPRYPRHQRLSPSEQALVDDQLARIGAVIL